MLTLFTGLPGNGKTLRALQYIAEWAKREGRAVWYHGVKGLKPELGWHQLPVSQEKFNGRDIEVPQWWLCPAGSIVLIDEAQMCGFGVRPRGVVPEWGQKLEVHRHLGIDVVFITQDPKLIDAHDRSLIEIHFHVMRTFGMQRATIHEFRPVRDNVKSRAGSIQHKWFFPKDVFSWYTSAEQHTHKARIPMKVWMLGGICLVLPALVWFTWSRYLDPHRAKPGVPQAVEGASWAGSPAGGKRMTKREWLEQQQPRVAGLAHSAPIFDEVTKPVEAPYPAACVQMGERCGCYTQQATRLEVPRGMCEQIVAGGFFVSWQLPIAKAQPLVGSGQALPVQAVQAGTGTFGGSAMRPVEAAVASDAPGVGRGKSLPKLVN